MNSTKIVLFILAFTFLFIGLDELTQGDLVMPIIRFLFFIGVMIFLCIPVKPNKKDEEIVK